MSTIVMIKKPVAMHAIFTSLKKWRKQTTFVKLMCNCVPCSVTLLSEITV